MIRITDADGLVMAVSIMTGQATQFDMAAREVVAPDILRMHVPRLSIDQMEISVAIFKQIAAEAQLPVFQSAVSEFEIVWERTKFSEIGDAVLDQSQAKSISNAITFLMKTLNSELQSRFIFIMNPSEIAYFNPSFPLFGQAVEDSFPSASEEIAEAGRCRASRRWTGCVIHLMRALEPALLALQKDVGVEVPKEQWQQIIDQIESKIRTINKKSHSSEDEQWYAEAATQFYFIKNAWRNYAAHGKDRYNEERAISIWNSTMSLMQQLATRLSE